jgi:hypothetical protein
VAQGASCCQAALWLHTMSAGRSLCLLIRSLPFAEIADSSLSNTAAHNQPYHCTVQQITGPPVHQKQHSSIINALSRVNAAACFAGLDPAPDLQLLLLCLHTPVPASASAVLCSLNSFTAVCNISRWSPESAPPTAPATAPATATSAGAQHACRRASAP